MVHVVRKVYRGVRKVYHGVRKVYHSVKKVYHGVRMVWHGVRKVIMVPVRSSPVQSSTLWKLKESIFKGQSNIRTVATVTYKRLNKQSREYRALQIFQSMAGLGSLANLEFGNYQLVILNWGSVFLVLEIEDFPNPKNIISQQKITNW